jgi:peptidoglycan hydrolase-like protein with peptidoglycan-binding domain
LLVLAVVVLIAAVGVTMVAGSRLTAPPRFAAPPGQRPLQPHASGSSCGSAGGWPVLCMHAQGTPVYALQYLLNGYDPTYNLTVDGAFGPRTRHAVQNFQQRAGVRGDASGVAGARTWAALSAQMEVHLHSAGSGVLALQYLLDHGPAVSSDRLSLDGSYGPKTQRALAAAERSLGLPTTDSVTPAVWRALLCATTSGCRLQTHGG